MTTDGIGTCVTTDVLWANYKRTGSRELRDRLILLYSPLVNYVAGRVSTGLPQTVEQCDLVSYGFFGLIDAIDKFDHKRKIKFETYATIRIRGAIIDGLRNIDWAPRSVRSKAKAIEKAYATLEAQLLRVPSDDEIARELGVSEGELKAQFSQIYSTGIVALDEPLQGIEENKTTLGDILTDPDESPMAAFELEEMKQILAKEISQLDDKEKMVLSLYYYEGLSKSEIGRIMGVTNGRICQIHAKAVLKLRARMIANDVMV